MATTMPGSATKVLARFTAAPSMTTEKYDETIKRLEASGAQWPPDGLSYHVAFSSGGSFRVSEVWDSREQFDAFGKTLRPVLTDVGVELAGEPEMLEVHNIIER
jgi:quinol monooxygenase YgiN